QRKAAEELEISQRHLRRLWARWRADGDKTVIHGLHGRPSPRKLSEETRSKAVTVLSQEVYRGFGPTFASEYLAKKHKITIGREALRQIMMEAGLWRGRKQRIEAIHEWRARHDSTEENLRLLWTYVERHGRPVSFYTDKASLFVTTEKGSRDRPGQAAD